MLLGILQSELKIENDNFYQKSPLFTLFFPLNPCFHRNNALYTFECDFIEFFLLFNKRIDILFIPYLEQKLRYRSYSAHCTRLQSAYLLIDI